MLIGERTAAWSGGGKSGPTAADYPNDNCIAFWDAIENAGWNTHNEQATGWVDLISESPVITVNNNIVFNEKSVKVLSSVGGYPLGDKYFFKSKIDDYSDYCVEFLAHFDSLPSSFGSYSAPITMVIQTKDPIRISPLWNGLNIMYSNTSETEKCYRIQQLVGTEVFMHVVANCSVNANDNGLWYNGQRVLTESTPLKFAYNLSGAFGAMNCDYDCMFMRVHNKALTASEIERTWNISKERFEIP